jgi:hypothetical protein
MLTLLLAKCVVITSGLALKNIVCQVRIRRSWVGKLSLKKWRSPVHVLRVPSRPAPFGGLRS